jgi:hypothetical protein
MRLRNDKNRNNGSDEDKEIKNLPQPKKYLYYMRLRNDKNRNNGSDEIYHFKTLPQPP